MNFEILKYLKKISIMNFENPLYFLSRMVLEVGILILTFGQKEYIILSLLSDIQ
jgi:hypothetical protein